MSAYRCLLKKRLIAAHDAAFNIKLYNEPERAVVMLKKIVLASISVLFLLGMGVFAADVQVDYHVNDISQGIINIRYTSL